MGVCLSSLHVFCRLEERPMTVFPRGVLWGILQEYGAIAKPSHPYITKVRAVSVFSAQTHQNVSDTFSVDIGLHQGCTLSPILFVMFMDRISMCSRGEESVHFGDLKIMSLLFADDVVLLALSDCDLQHTPGRSG